MASTRSIVKSLLSVGTAALLWTTGFTAPASAAAVITVGTPSATCPNPKHATIQGAVTAAKAGDTIRVCAGTYNESVSVTKPLRLLGAQAGVDARSGRTNPARESIVHPPGGDNGITVAGGVSNVTIQGFTVQNSSVDGIVTLQAGSGFRILDNIITHNRIGVQFRSPGTTRSLIARNRIVDNNVASPDTGGTGIFFGGGQGSNNVDVAYNRFSGHVNADINTAGTAADPHDDLTIAYNTSVNSATFLVLINADGPTVAYNQVTKSSSVQAGTGILIDANTQNARVVENTLTGGQGAGVRIASEFGPTPSTGLTFALNEIRSRTDGLLVQRLDSGRFLRNQISGSTDDGIEVESGVNSTSPLQFTSNRSTGNTDLDALDATTGGGTAGTANTWRQNVCPKDSPNGICL